MNIEIIKKYDFYGNETDHARGPYITKLSDGRFILGINILHNSPKLSHDWDTRQKPHYIIGSTPDELMAKQPSLLSDKHGLPPYFFECNDGSILTAYNSWKEYHVESTEGKEILKDKENHPFVWSHLYIEKVLGVSESKYSKSDILNAELLGWDDYSDEQNKIFGVLQPITILKSSDRGNTWHEHGKIYYDPEKMKNGSAFRGNMIQLDDGEIIFAASGVDDKNPDKPVYCLRSSRDGGKTWHIKSRLRIPNDEISETHIFRQKSGRITLLCRTVKSRQIAIAHSDDNGLTWCDDPRLTNIWGFPCHALAHSSGKVILTWFRRGTGPRGLKCKILQEDFSDIDSAPEIWLDEIHEEGRGGGGYPSSVELEDGSILTVIFGRLEEYGPFHIIGFRYKLV